MNKAQGGIGYANSSAVPADVDVSSKSLFGNGGTAHNGSIVHNRYLVGDEFYCRSVVSESNTENTYTGVHMPWITLGTAWYGRRITFSCWIRSADWTKVDQGIGVQLSLMNASNARCFFGTKYGIVSSGKEQWGSNESLKTEGDLKSREWRRFGITFTLDETEIPNKVNGTNTLFSDCAYLRVSCFLVRNGDLRMMKPQLEWGEIMTDWSEAAFDANEYSSARIKLTADQIQSAVDGKASGTALTQTANDLLSVARAAANTTTGDLATSISKVKQNHCLFPLFFAF